MKPSLKNDLLYMAEVIVVVIAIALACGKAISYVEKSVADIFSEYRCECPILIEIKH